MVDKEAQVVAVEVKVEAVKEWVAVKAMLMAMERAKVKAIPIHRAKVKVKERAKEMAKVKEKVKTEMLTKKVKIMPNPFPINSKKR